MGTVAPIAEVGDAN